MARDYAAIIAALREKAKRTDSPQEKVALETKAKELETKYKVKDKPNTDDPWNTDSWIRDNYRMSRDQFVREFFKPTPRPPASQFLIVVTGEDQKWRHSYLWPQDGSPMMNPDHSWEDTDWERE
jgi:hypothetical protein